MKDSKQKVRIVAGPFEGSYGVILAGFRNPRLAHSFTVKLNDGKRITVNESEIERINTK